MNEDLKLFIKAKGEIVVCPQGSSMLPFLKAGRDEVVIVPPKTIEKYDIILYEADGVQVLHRVLAADESLTVCGDHNGVSETVEREQVIGVVKAVLRRGREKSPKPRLYCFLWYGLRMKRVAIKLKK